MGVKLRIKKLPKVNPIVSKAVVGRVKKFWQFPRIMQLIFIIAGLLLISGTYLYIRASRAQAPKQPQISETELENRVNQLTSEKKYEEAEKLLKGQSYANTSKITFVQLGTLAYNRGDFQGALTYFKHAEKKFGLDAGLAKSIAETAYKANNKRQAIEYYQKAADLARKDTSNPLSGSDANDYLKEKERIESE